MVGVWARLPRATPRRVLAAVLLCGLVPWSVQLFSASTIPFLRFVWGGLSFTPVIYARTLPEYLALSGSPLLVPWVVAAACWLLAVASASLALVDREDPRVTAGLLVLAGAVNASVALRFGIQPSRTGYPVGTLALWAVAAWRYRAWTRQ
ncbi:TIGR04206 family protein [Halobaculum magnesiiphilum]|uniref:TIGR04206 family protein n=1 Tax=Halobaculum magnesiiphilum TaxID=1017351 RepID=A0A8T8WA95_9EURY|nr:TIGR04206 family protein [Halobaculum magnesiiphilum]QZP36779.1 TIGR04206 family protein [Halobaculum magnesiiphilum]